MLTRATEPQNATLARLKELFTQSDIQFTLVGAAACREYGLTRPTTDLDFVISPYPEAMAILLNSGKFELNQRDFTNRCCTQKDLKTNVPVDFLTGGIRINDGTYSLRGGYVTDRLPVIEPSGFGNIAALRSLYCFEVIDSSQRP